CMVSSEGACAAYYNFGRFSRQRVREATQVHQIEMPQVKASQV
ncbi:MAG: hydrogenase formation protein HypD, partial [Pseudonocardiaceae bacterium]